MKLPAAPKSPISVLRVLRVFALMLFPCSLLADIVHLKSGGTVEGKAVDEGDTVRVSGAFGSASFPKSMVAKIETCETDYDRYLARKAAMNQEDAGAWEELGRWCRELEMDRLADEAFGRAIALDPSRESAHKALGHRLHEGRWITYDAWMAAQGMVKVKGRWMTHGQASDLAGREAEVTRLEKLESEIRQAHRMLRDRDEARRDAGFTRALDACETYKAPEAVKEWVHEAKSYYDGYWATVVEYERSRVTMELRLAKGDLQTMRQTTPMQGGVASPPPVLQLPHLEYQGYQGTVIAPGN